MLERCLAAAGDDPGEVLLGGLAGVEQRPGLQRREADRVGPQRAEDVGLELQREHPADVTGRALAEGVDQRGVDVAVLQPDPRLVEREGAVHLDVRLRDRRPRADGVERRHEGEGLTGEVVGRAGAGEAHVLRREAGRLQRLPDDGQQDLHLVAGVLPARGVLREGDDGYVAHQTRAVLERLVLGIGLVDRLDVVDVGQGVVPLALGEPVRLHAHAHPGLVRADALEQHHRGGVGAVERDLGRDVGQVDRRGWRS